MESLKINRYFEDGTYSIVYIDQEIEKNYSPFGECSSAIFADFPCDGCHGKSNPLTFWVNINVNSTPENPLPDGTVGCFAKIGYFCTECRPTVEPYIQNLYQQAKERKLGKLKYLLSRLKK